MRQVMRELNHEQGDAFNDKVADGFVKTGLWRVRRRVKKIRSATGTIGPPGDIDVLAANQRTHLLYVIECKDLALARTPRELANELVALFEGEGGEMSAMEKHRARVVWVREHSDDILTLLGFSPKDRWR